MKFIALTSLIILATSVVQAETEEEKEEREGNEEYLRSDKRKEDFKAQDDLYEETQIKNELMLTNGIKVDWCATEDKKRHVVASVPGVLGVRCPDCVTTYWPNAIRWLDMESKQFDNVEVRKMGHTKIQPKLIFFNKHSVACLPADEDVTKYNTVADIGEKFEVIEANNYYTFDRELYPVWDEVDIFDKNKDWTVSDINAYMATKGIHKNPELQAKYEKDAQKFYEQDEKRVAKVAEDARFNALGEEEQAAEKAQKKAELDAKLKKIDEDAEKKDL